MRFHTSGIECGGRLTIVKVRDCLQDVAVGVEGFWPTDAGRGVSVRVQDDLCVDKVSGGYSFVKSLAKSSCGRHGCGLLMSATLGTCRIYSKPPGAACLPAFGQLSKVRREEWRSRGFNRRGLRMD